MTSMRLRTVFSFSFADLLLLCCGAVQWWGGGGGGRSGGGGGGGDDVHATATCVCFFLS